jgi:hypothetical protein
MNPRICIVLLLFVTLVVAQNPFTILKPNPSSPCQLNQPCLIEWTIDPKYVKDIFITGKPEQNYFGTDKILVYLIWHVNGVQQSLHLTKDILGIDIELNIQEVGLWCNGQLPSVPQTPTSPKCPPTYPCTWSPVIQGVQPGTGYTIQFNDTSTPSYVHPNSQNFTITPPGVSISALLPGPSSSSSTQSSSTSTPVVTKSPSDLLGGTTPSDSNSQMSNPVVIGVLCVVGAALAGLILLLLFLRRRRNRLRQLQFQQQLQQQQQNPQMVQPQPKYGMAGVPNHTVDNGNVLPVFNQKPLISQTGGPVWAQQKDNDWFPR